MSRQEHEVFISFSRDQFDFAEKLWQILVSEGFCIWYAPKAIDAGVSWSEAFPEAAANSKVMLLIWSAGAASSPYVKTEYLEAMEHKRSIIPIVRDSTPLPSVISKNFQAVKMIGTSSLDPGVFYSVIGEIVKSIHLLLPGSPEIIPDPPIFLPIPEGSFYPGSATDPERYGNELTSYEAFDIPYEFQIAKYPVLVPEYRIFLEKEQGYTQHTCWTDAGWAWRERLNIEQPHNWPQQDHSTYYRYPVSGVSFYEAVAYSNWYTLYRQDGFIYRLPTETEWEKAARGGLNLTHGHPNPLPRRIFPWGDNWDKTYANTQETGWKQIISVDEHPDRASSAYGVVGMAGNLSEWCLNVPDNYPSYFIDSAEGNIKRVQRGGNLQYTMADARCSCRIIQPPVERYLTSIRLVRVQGES